MQFGLYVSLSECFHNNNIGRDLVKKSYPVEPTLAFEGDMGVLSFSLPALATVIENQWVLSEFFHTN